MIQKAEVYRYNLPLTAPVQLGGERISERRGFLLRLRDQAGHEGWGEAAPLPGFSRESIEQAWNGLVRCARLLTNRPLPETEQEIAATGLMPLLEARSVAFAVEAAILNLRAAEKRASLHRLLTGNVRHSLPLNALLDGDKRAILKKAALLTELDYRAAKLKVGRRRMEQDVDLVQRVRECLGPGPRLRLDANRAWTYEEAVIFGRHVEECDIEYIEEPLQNIMELPGFTAETGIPYALDETLQETGVLLDAAREAERQGQPLHSAQAEILEKAHRLIWKPTLVHYPNIGGLITEMKAASNRIVVSAAFESGVGTAALAQYAAACSEPDMPCGLDTYAWLAEDVLVERLPLNRGAVDLDKIQSVSENVDPDRLELVWEG